MFIAASTANGNEGLDVPSTHLQTLVNGLSWFGPVNAEELRPIVRYLSTQTLSDNQVLWRQGDAPDALYIVESGVLKGDYTFEDKIVVTEKVVAGTIAGKLSALSGLPHNATCRAEGTTRVLKLTLPHLRTLEQQIPVFRDLLLQGEIVRF